MKSWNLQWMNILFCTNAFSFQVPLIQTSRHTYHHCLKAINKNNNNDLIIPNLKSKINEEIILTNRGLKRNMEQTSKIESLLLDLESNCPLKEPARDPGMEGIWRVEYTTAPPPSNGQLGPFVGTARQIIDLQNGSYINALEVEPNEWLKAELKAKWMEWDGTLLENDDDDDGDDVVMEEDVNGNDIETVINQNPFALLQTFFTNARNPSTSSTKDYGATSWKVDFEMLSIQLFGIPIVTKQFENTSRIWRMSYLDSDTRIVRAGRTGKEEDDFVFYMTKEIQKK